MWPRSADIKMPVVLRNVDVYKLIWKAPACTKLGVRFWDHLGSRLRLPGSILIPPLDDYVRCRGRTA